MTDQTYANELLKDLKKLDYLQFASTLFVPEGIREKILAVYLFEHEIAEIHFKAQNQLAREIRYKWWRESLDEISEGKLAKSPLLNILVELKIDSNNLKRIIDLYEKISTGEYCNSLSELIDYLTSEFNSLELICDYLNEKTDKKIIRKLFAISFISNLLQNYFIVVNSSYLKPLPSDLIDKYSFNTDLFKDQTNISKLKQIAEDVCSRLTEELNNNILNLDRSSQFLKAFIFNTKFTLKLLKKQNYDLNHKYHYNRFVYLIKFFLHLLCG